MTVMVIAVTFKEVIPSLLHSVQRSSKQGCKTVHTTLKQSLHYPRHKRVNLSPGMNITAEIKTGRRRVIEYLLSPVQRAGSESLRER